MEYKLIEINMDMGKDEYDMYQDIPSKEPGSTNLCKGTPYEVFKQFLESQIAKKYQSTSNYCTPTINYIFYVNDKPVGVIGIRIDIDENWKKWSGNFYYVIRLSERKKGYGTMMLQYALKELKKFGTLKCYGKCSKLNVSSYKVMENNGGKLINEDNNSKYYEFNI